MDLGWLDVCLRVSDVASSRCFYEGLGFRAVEGSDCEGWAVVVNGESRLGLFEPRYMEGDPLSLNFRGGDVPALVATLQASGYQFERVSSSGRSAVLRDPDGHLIFLDAAPGETKKV